MERTLSVLECPGEREEETKSSFATPVELRTWKQRTGAIHFPVAVERLFSFYSSMLFTVHSSCTFPWSKVR